MSDFSLWILLRRLYIYSDVMVANTSLVYAENRDTVTNSVAIAEILSDSQSDYQNILSAPKRLYDLKFF